MSSHTGHISDRFLGRAAVYASARPGYPKELGTWLRAALPASEPVVDIGAGTGIFTAFLLGLGARVIAIEPNMEMRAELTESMARRGCSSQVEVRDGSAEATGLDGSSVGLIVAAQAAHWFSPVPTVAEFRRILAPNGRVVLVWNDWREVDAPFNRGYGELVRAFLTPGNENVHTRIPDGRIPELLPGGFRRQQFRNRVPLRRERLHALALSASYLPGPGDDAGADLLQALDRLFDTHRRGDEVTLEYRTVAYLGEMGSAAR